MQLIVWSAGAILTLDALIRLLGSLSRRTFGRWRHARSQLRRLAANADIGFFTSVLGAPFLRREHNSLLHEVRGRLTEYVFVGLGFYVQAITDEHGLVVIFTVTARENKLKAKIPIPNFGMYTSEAKPLELKLGSSHMADCPWPPDKVYAYVGAHSFGYYESYYLANPGNYQTLVLSWNESGIGSLTDNRAPLEQLSSNEPSLDVAREELLSSPEGIAVRRETVINSYSLTAPGLTVDLRLDELYGVRHNDVRVLVPPTRGDLRKWVWSRRIERAQRKLRGLLSRGEVGRP